MQKPKRQIEGYLFPIPHKFAERLLSGKKDVFVKFGRTHFLKAGNTIAFYDSDAHAVIGEGKIKKIVCADPSAIVKEFGERLFLEVKEFNDYVARSPLGPRKLEGRVMTAFVLGSSHRYSTPTKPKKRVTPNGYYLPVDLNS